MDEFLCSYSFYGQEKGGKMGTDWNIASVDAKSLNPVSILLGILG